MFETLANGYSSESAQRELSNGYQHDKVCMFFKKNFTFFCSFSFVHPYCIDGYGVGLLEGRIMNPMHLA